MTDATDVAETVLERAVPAMQKGKLDPQVVAWTFAASSLYLACATAPTGPAQPFRSVPDGHVIVLDGQRLTRSGEMSDEQSISRAWRDYRNIS